MLMSWPPSISSGPTRDLELTVVRWSIATARSSCAPFRPDILCEVLPDTADTEELEALLAPHGYGLYLVREADLLPAGRLEPDARFRDWFFTTQTPDELASIGLALASGSRSDRR
jgi:hypothetical protein